MIIDPYKHPPSSPPKKLTFYQRLWKKIQKKIMIKSLKFIKAKNRDLIYYVLVNDNHVGTIELAKKNEFKKTITIQSAYISKFWQRCGIMTKFYEMIREEKKKEGYALVPPLGRILTGAGNAFWQSKSSL